MLASIQSSSRFTPLDTADFIIAVHALMQAYVQARFYMFHSVQHCFWCVSLGSGLGHLSRLEGVEDMLEMPYGCGEQNMLRFSVNTYILRYLTRSCASKPRASAEPLHPYLRRKALNFMKEGMLGMANCAQFCPLPYERSDCYMLSTCTHLAFGHSIFKAPILME